MALFRRDTAAALVKARADLAAAQARLGELQGKRGPALVESDDVAAVQALDRQMAAQRETIVILTDRIAALAEQLRRERRDEIERRRAAGIAALKKDFAVREELAREVEVLVEKFGEAWGRLLDSRGAITENWPDVFPRPRLTDLSSRIDRELSWHLFAAGKPTPHSACKIPAPSNQGLGITGISPKGLAGAIAIEHEGLLARLEAMPVPDDEEDVAA